MFPPTASRHSRAVGRAGRRSLPDARRYSNAPDGEPASVVDVEDVVATVDVVVTSTVVVVTWPLHSDGSASQASFTAATQAFLQRARALP